MQQCFILLELNYTLCYNVKQGGSFLVFDDLWRSGNQNNYNNAYCMAPSGGNTNNNVTNAYGVRPALHSLTKWCKFSCIRQMVGKWLLKFSNWRYEYEGTYYPAFYNFQKAKQTRPFYNGFFFCGMNLKKWSSYFFYPPQKSYFVGTPLYTLDGLNKALFILLNTHNPRFFDYGYAFTQNDINNVISSLMSSRA